MKSKILLSMLLLILPFSCPAHLEVIRGKMDPPPPAPLPSAQALMDSQEKVMLIIKASKENLAKQEALLKDITEYQQIQKKYSENSQDKEIAYQMVMKAYDIMQHLKELRMTHAFDQDLMSEITFFSNMAERWNGNQS